MPLYEYRCQSCGKVFEVMQKFSDEPLTIHEGCGGVVERLLSPPAFQFKGSGWYITDYARKADGKGDSKPSKDGDSKPTSTGTSCCGSKSDSDSK
jgi:putative FmdB family regulatory protein